jgi:hypothetical protein
VVAAWGQEAMGGWEWVVTAMAAAAAVVQVKLLLE